MFLGPLNDFALRAQLYLAHVAFALHVKTQTRALVTQCALNFVPLPIVLTVQAAVVVLPVCTHSILFTDKHHFGHTHPHQTSTLQGPAHTE